MRKIVSHSVRDQKKNALHVLAATAVVLLMGFGIEEAIHSSLFRLKAVEVTAFSDGYPLTRDQVLNLAKVPLGKYSLFDIHLTPVEQRLLGHPWIKGVVLGKQFPDTLSIKVVERVPVALLTEAHGKVLYLEKDGTLFEDQAMVYSKDLPILSGFSGTSTDHLKKVDQFIETWFNPEQVPGIRLSSISYDEKLGLRAVILYPLKNQQWMRTILEMGLNIEEASTIPQQRLLKVLAYLSERSMQASKIWLGDGKKIVVKISRGS